jgi:hypothetical protein
MTTVDADALLADIARKRKRVDEISRQARLKLGAPNRTRRKVRLSAEQRAAAYRAKRGPLGWLFAGSSPEDVVRDSTFLRKIHHIYKVRPYMRGVGRTTIHLPSGKSVKFDTRRGEVIRL